MRIFMIIISTAIAALAGHLSCVMSAEMESVPMDNRENHRPIASELKFVVGAAIVSIGLILLSIAFGVSIDPDASIFSSP